MTTKKVVYKIYQFNKVFRRYHGGYNLKSYLDEVDNEINIRRYDKVYNGVIEVNMKLNEESVQKKINMILEQIFELLNINHPSDYKAKSLSVGDLVYIFDKYYYVDSLGFKEVEVVEKVPTVEFDEYLAYERKSAFSTLLNKQREKNKTNQELIQFVNGLIDDYKQFAWEEDYRTVDLPSYVNVTRE